MPEATIAVIPAYNEAPTVGAVVSKAATAVDTVLVVDDGSADDTAAVARSCGAVVERHSTNRGVGAALRTGYRFAAANGYDRLVQLDADGQHDPDDIPAFLEAVGRYDVVIGSRYRNESFRRFSMTRRAGIRLLSAAVRFLSGVAITDVTSGFRAYQCTALPAVEHHCDRHWAVEQTLLAGLNGLSVTELSTEMAIRRTGASKFSAPTLAAYPFWMAAVAIRTMLRERTTTDR